VKPKKVAAEKPKSTAERKIDRLRKAVERNPESVDALLDLGMAILESGEPVDAFLHIKKATSLSPDSQRAHYAMGMAYKALGNKNKALVEFQEVIRLDKSGPFSDQSMTQILDLKK
jgi:Tfp pilus assembly protein PilF